MRRLVLIFLLSDLFMIYRYMYIYLLYVNVLGFFYFGDVHRCTLIFYMLIKYTLLYLFGLLTSLISMVRSIYKQIEKNLAHSRLNIA